LLNAESAIEIGSNAGVVGIAGELADVIAKTLKPCCACVALHAWTWGMLRDWGINWPQCCRRMWISTTIIEFLPAIAGGERAPERITVALASNTLADVAAARDQPVSLFG
jgi:hypothetical protein